MTTSNDNNQQQQQQQSNYEPNPITFGYLCVACWSLALVPTLKEIPSSFITTFATIWSSITLILSLLIILFDRISCLRQVLNLKEHLILEGGILVFFCLFWSIGVGIITQANGIAYRAMNIYVISWGNFFAALYALDQWCVSKEMLSWKLLTRLSETLKGWYCLLFASSVELFSGVNVLVILNNDGYGDESNFYGDVIFAIIGGFITVILCIVVILLHYQILDCCCSTNRWNGVIELCFSIFLSLFWVIGVGTLTSGSSIAPSIIGRNCTLEEFVPGSNIYVATWMCFLSSCWIMLKWKKAKAIHLAHMEDSKVITMNESQDIDHDILQHPK